MQLLNRQAQQLRNEQSHHVQTSSVPFEQTNNTPPQLKDRLSRIEYEHRELKELVWELHNDLSALIVQKPTYRSIVRIPNFAKPK